MGTLELCVVSIFVCELVGITGSFFTRTAIPQWYDKLKKPSFRPPNWLFGPVWTLLYALMGISAVLIYRSVGFFSPAMAAFGVQLLLNAVWTPLFFGLRKLGAAFVEILLLWMFILSTIFAIWPFSRPAAWLLVPYLAWVSFASLLNYKLWRMNG